MWKWHTRIEIVNDVTYPIIKDCSKIKLYGFFPTTKTKKTNYAINFKYGDKTTELYYISENDKMKIKKWNKTRNSRYMNVNMLKETPFVISVKDMNLESSNELCERCECCECCTCNNLTKQKQCIESQNKVNETKHFAKWHFVLKLKN